MNQTRGTSERERELTANGWTRQFLANEPRLSEAVELYQTIGYEVHLEPLTRGDEIDPQGCEGCTTCFDGFEDEYKVIYTRPKKEKLVTQEELW